MRNRGSFRGSYLSFCSFAFLNTEKDSVTFAINLGHWSLPLLQSLLLMQEIGTTDCYFHGYRFTSCQRSGHKIQRSFFP